MESIKIEPNNDFKDEIMKTENSGYEAIPPLDMDKLQEKKMSLLQNLHSNIKLQDEFNVKFAKQNMTLNTLKMSIASGYDPKSFPRTNFE